MNEGTTSYPWWRNDVSVIAALTAFAVIAFTATYFISRSFETTQESLARHWLQQGDHEMKQGAPALAVADYRTALVFSHNDSAYRLRLAQALAADGQTSQAIAYFLNLLEEQPGNGLYNLELARLFSKKGEARQAALYYNGAIYGAWVKDPATERRHARSEFVRFLMSRNSQTQAQAEAIVLAAGIPENDIPARFEAAKLLRETGAFNRAFDEYSSLMNSDSVAASLGAGEAAFQAGRFDSAARFLNTAIARGSKDLKAQLMLQQAQQVLDTDPDQRRISSAERGRRVTAAFESAERRLERCASSKRQPAETIVPATDLQQFYAERSQMNSRLHQRRLAVDPDLRDSVMDVVTRIESSTAQACGMPTGGDWALLMLARYREGVEH